MCWSRVEDPRFAEEMRRNEEEATLVEKRAEERADERHEEQAEEREVVRV